MNYQYGSQFKRLMGSLRSRHPAAYLGIMIQAARPVTRLVDQALGHLTPARQALLSGQVRCAFIVCPPRSGGTVVYQALTCALPSVYLSNAHALFPQLGTRLLRTAREQLAACQSFDNYYGYTSNFFDVYEGNEFLDWAHRVSTGIGEVESTHYLRAEFDHLIEILSPLPSECVIFKNARAYSLVGKLHRAIPEIIFVRVQRDRSQVVESVVRAFHELGSFHPVPPSVRARGLQDPIEFVCAQIEAIEAELDAQLANLPPSAQMRISYEAFCECPYEFINILAYDFLELAPGSVRECPALARLKPSRRLKVSEAEQLKIQALLAEQTRMRSAP